MFLAMNRFKVSLGKEEDFISIWKNRESYLDGVPGFLSFNLLQGETNEDHTLFSSHAMWESRTAFVDWTQSESFRNAHKNAGAAKHVYNGHPKLELFDAVI
jgi:heme-degrading monooxygenase HmoA